MKFDSTTDHWPMTDFVLNHFLCWYRYNFASVLHLSVNNTEPAWLQIRERELCIVLWSTAVSKETYYEIWNSIDNACLPITDQGTASQLLRSKKMLELKLGQKCINRTDIFVRRDRSRKDWYSKRWRICYRCRAADTISVEYSWEK